MPEDRVGEGEDALSLTSEAVLLASKATKPNAIVPPFNGPDLMPDLPATCPDENSTGSG